MSQKHLKGELSVVTPSGKIRSISKTDRMKNYGKSALINIRNGKFEEFNESSPNVSKLKKSQKKINDKSFQHTAEGNMFMEFDNDS